MLLSDEEGLTNWIRATTLQYHPRRGVETNTSLRKFSPPQVAGTSIQWSSPQLGVAGSWEATAQPIRHTILESTAGNIEWNCLHPRAKAEIRIGDEQRIAGLGYVDHVTMSVWRDSSKSRIAASRRRK